MPPPEHAPYSQDAPVPGSAKSSDFDLGSRYLLRGKVGSGVSRRSRCLTFITHRAPLMSLCKSQFPHKSVNLFFILVIVKDKFTDLWGG